MATRRWNSYLRQGTDFRQLLSSQPLVGLYSETCLERPPVLKDHILLTEGPTFLCNSICHQRPPVLRDHIFNMANGAIFQDRWYCTTRTGADLLALIALQGTTASRRPVFMVVTPCSFRMHHVQGAFQTSYVVHKSLNMLKVKTIFSWNIPCRLTWLKQTAKELGQQGCQRVACHVFVHVVRPCTCVLSHLIIYE